MSIAQGFTNQLPDVALLATGTQATAARAVKNRRLSIKASWTGTPTGVVSLQTSFDGGATFDPVPGASAEFTNNGNAQPTGGVGSAVWNFINVPGGLWRLLYTATSGTGTLSTRYSQGN